jgi:uncharacterized protein
MIYNVAGLLKDIEGSSRQFEIAGEQVFTDRHHFREVSGQVQMLRTDRTVLVTSVITAKADDECGRCLERAEINVEIEFAEEFSPVNTDLVDQRPAPVEAQYDPALVIDERNVLDLTDALAQALSASAPIAPLCRPDCAGLCPNCFVNRNEIKCRCDQNPTDSRWQALAGLMSEPSN